MLAETGGVSPEGMDNHGDRPEVVQARSEGQGYSLRASGTLHKNFAYAARNLPDGRILRLALPLDSVNLLIQKRLHVFAPMILLAVVLAVVLAAFISGAMRRSLGQMVDVVSAISRGRLQRRLRRLPGTEFAPLAEAVNRMADSIGEQVRIASDKTAQLESVLNTMSDGVLVLGPQGRIRRCNGAFARLFPQVTDMAGSPVIEVIPSPELQDAVDAMLRSAQVARSSSGNGDEDLDVPRSLRQVQLHLGGRVFSVLISLPVLADARLGAVLVFRDISDLMQLERIRSDFVANVSHELRTPLRAMPRPCSAWIPRSRRSTLRPSSTATAVPWPACWRICWCWPVWKGREAPWSSAPRNAPPPWMRRAACARPACRSASCVWKAIWKNCPPCWPTTVC